MDESYSTARPMAGRMVALEFRPARPLTLLGPAWAALCGAVASGGIVYRSQSLLNLILLFLLCDALMGAWRAIWLEADWRTALPRNLASAHVWLRLSDDKAGSFFARLPQLVSNRIRFAQNTLWPLIDSEIMGMLTAGILAVCIAVVLGLVPTILTGIGLVLALIEGQWGQGRSEVWRAIYEIGLPWLIAQSAFSYFTWVSFAFVVLATLAYLALLTLERTRRDRWMIWSNAVQLTILLLLIFLHKPIGAGIVALGLLAQLLWQAKYRMDRDGRSYARRVQSYLLAAMLVAAFSLWI